MPRMVKANVENAMPELGCLRAIVGELVEPDVLYCRSFAHPVVEWGAIRALEGAQPRPQVSLLTGAPSMERHGSRRRDVKPCIRGHRHPGCLVAVTEMRRRSNSGCDHGDRSQRQADLLRSRYPNAGPSDLSEPIRSHADCLRTGGGSGSPSSGKAEAEIS